LAGLHPTVQNISSKRKLLTLFPTYVPHATFNQPNENSCSSWIWMTKALNCSSHEIHSLTPFSRAAFHNRFLPQHAS